MAISVEDLLREFADLSSPSLSISRGSHSKEEFARITAAIDAAINKSPPDWTSVTVERGVVYIPDQPTSKEDLRKPRDPVKAEGTFDVQIARAPFSRGGVRVAHYANARVKFTRWAGVVAGRGKNASQNNLWSRTIKLLAMPTWAWAEAQHVIPTKGTNVHSQHRGEKDGKKWKKRQF